MKLYDSELAEIIKEHTPVEILDGKYYVEPARGGSCDGCVFNGVGRCPQKAVTYCTSNGGNIMVEADDKQRKS